jgi:ketosteroid isomerase-like protein
MLSPPCSARHDRVFRCPGTGRPVAVTAVIVQEVREGRITAERHYMELLEFFAQVGLLGIPGG